MSITDEFGEPTTADVEQHLSRILESRRFRNAPKMRQLLCYLIQRTIQGDGDQLNAAGIARHVFDKGENFKSFENPVVRVATNRLREALALYNAIEGASSDIVIILEPNSYVPKVKYRTPDHMREASVDALSKAVDYQNHLTETKYLVAHTALISALKDEPENVELLSAFADVCLDAYKYDWGDEPEQMLDRGWRVLESALSIDRNNPNVAFELAMYELHAGNLDEVASLSHQLLRAHRNDPETAMLGNWMLALTMDPNAAAKILNLDPPSGSETPGWMYHPAFLAHYYIGDYESALISAINFGMPDFYWGPLERAAALAQLGLTDAARCEAENLLKLNPSFAESPRRHLSEYIPHLEAMEHVLEGLQKAGLPT